MLFIEFVSWNLYWGIDLDFEFVPHMLALELLCGLVMAFSGQNFHATEIARVLD